MSDKCTSCQAAITDKDYYTDVCNKCCDADAAVEAEDQKTLAAGRASIEQKPLDLAEAYRKSKGIEAAPSQEPAGYLCQGIFYTKVEEQPENSIPLYATPPDATAQIAKLQDELSAVNIALKEERHQHREQIATLNNALSITSQGNFNVNARLKIAVTALEHFATMDQLLVVSGMSRDALEQIKEIK